jgi:SAM-dependent methyltransferase
MDRHRSAWEDWGRVDPYWAALTAAESRGGLWDVDAFFATGEEVVATMLAQAAQFERPVEHGTALDFGCGPGRLTRALAPHFERTYGLDVAATMIEEAQRRDPGSGAELLVHDRDDLSQFASRSIDFLACVLVLQHLPSREAIERYLREFVRVLSPGGVAVIQLPVYVPPPGPPSLRARLRVRTRTLRTLRALGISPRFLYRRLAWQPEMPMSAIPYADTVAVIESAGGHVLESIPETTDSGGVVSRVYLVAPASADTAS